MSYVSLATTTLGSAASSVTFSSIPATYRDLIIVFNGATTLSTVGLVLQFNSDSGSNYSGVVAQGDGSSATSGTLSGTSAEVGVLNTGRGNVLVQVMDYSATDKHKTFLSRGDNATDRTRMTASRWANTAAINTVRVATNLNLIAVGSTISLYGVAA
jgi:hypothetical protein